MIATINTSELDLIISLSSRNYSGNSLLSKASPEENDKLKEIRRKLKNLANYFSQKYHNVYGPFEVSVSTGNPIAMGGTTLNRVWSGIFKGGTNKQYSAQVSIVINPEEACLDVGFYFGRASSHSVSSNERKILEAQLNQLGIDLSNAISGNPILNEKYNALFDIGFHSFANGKITTPDNWVSDIRIHTKSSQIVAKVYPNDFGHIENSTLDFYIGAVMSLMSAFQGIQTPSITIKPLTPEQRAKQAQRLAEIGYKGELFILESEREKLKNLNLQNVLYPRHVAMESPSYGYDILSVDENNQEIFIEVKTTTRIKTDNFSKRFYISLNEYAKFTNNQSKYRLYRVYDIEGDTSMEEVDLKSANKAPDGYIISF